MLIRTFFSIFLALVTLSQVQADNGSIIPQKIVAVGQVKFEQRSLRVVTGTITDSQQQKYWSMVVISNGVKYIFDQRYYTKPASIELSGQVLRPGSMVKVEGLMVQVTPSLYEVLSVQSLNLVMDIAWSCLAVKDSNPILLAEIWRSYEESRGKYAMSVFRIDGSHELHPIASLDNAKVSEGAGAVSFEGQAQETRLDLNINRKVPGTNYYRGTLKMSGVSTQPGDGMHILPIEAFIEMVCDSSLN